MKIECDACGLIIREGEEEVPFLSRCVYCLHDYEKCIKEAAGYAKLWEDLGESGA